MDDFGALLGSIWMPVGPLFRHMFFGRFFMDFGVPEGGPKRRALSKGKCSRACVNIDILSKSEVLVWVSATFRLSGFPESLRVRFPFGNLTLSGGLPDSVRETGASRQGYSGGIDPGLEAPHATHVPEARWRIYIYIYIEDACGGTSPPP